MRTKQIKFGSLVVLAAFFAASCSNKTSSGNDTTMLILLLRKCRNYAYTSSFSASGVSISQTCSYASNSFTCTGSGFTTTATYTSVDDFIAEKDLGITKAKSITTSVSGYTSSSTNYTYDSSGRLSGFTAGTFYQSYSNYDSKGRPKSYTYGYTTSSSTATGTLTYDDSARTVTDSWGTSTVYSIIYTYDTDGNLSSLVYKTGSTTTYSYTYTTSSTKQQCNIL